MITILIPTYNRPDYLKRILSYYNDYQIAYNIIVADSSSDENKELNKKAISPFSNLNISYINNYPLELNPYYKLADALNSVNTKYCVFCADDDFITPNGINQSVDFLENNPDFTVAHGRYISFRLEKTRGKKERFCWGPTYYSHKSIAFSDPKSRLSHHPSESFIPSFYAVPQTDISNLSWGETLKSTGDYRFGELLPSMLTLIYGKMKCLDVLYGARDADSIRTVYLPSSEDFAKSDTYNEQYAKFRDCLAMHLTKRSQLDVEASKKVIDDAMSAHMKKYCYNYKRVLLHKAEYVLEHLPARMDKGIRALYRKLFLPRQGTDYPISYYNDLNKIRLCVLSRGNMKEMMGTSAQQSKGAI